MSVNVLNVVGTQLASLAERQGSPFSVVLHGGEPLLLGPEGLRNVLRVLRSALPSTCGIHLQTNGVLLSDEIIEICADYAVGISISIDGPASVHDGFRVDHRNRPSHTRVFLGIQRLKDHPRGQGLFSGVIAVVDPRSEVAEVYNFLKGTGAPSIDFLYRDGNHSKLPFGKASFESTEYGTWMCQLLKLYLTDRTPPRIRILDDLIRLSLGGGGIKEGSGDASYGILIIDTDGRISKNDTLKSAHDFADHFEDDVSVLRNHIADIVQSSDFSRYYAAQKPHSPVCQSCPDLRICGGGMLTHRWHDVTGFENPSVFCFDQRLLIGQIRLALDQYRGAA
jgi:uncharacterized protein